jgi:hypothetical protein
MHWLHTTFQVHRHVVVDALYWLKEHNAKYYGDVEINKQQLLSLPRDDVPVEILVPLRQMEDIGVVNQEMDLYMNSSQAFDDELDPGEGEDGNYLIFSQTL